MVKKKLTEIEKKIKNTILPVIDYSHQKSVSYSQFSIYQQCPHRWSLENVYGCKIYKPNINLIFGTAFHETLQSYIETMYNESGAAADKMNLHELLQTKLSTVYSEEYKKTGAHFSTPKEMGEFYEDGIAILDWIKKNRNKIFTIRKVRLLGIEFPLILEVVNNIYYKAYIDFALYDEDLDKVYIFDIKTSTYSSKQYRQDKLKQQQLLSYKLYFSKQYGYPLDKIDVQFFVVKRKIQENSEFPQPRASLFSISSGKTSLNLFEANFQTFIKDCFDESGKPQIKSYIKNIGENSCKWCPFRDNNELCSR